MSENVQNQPFEIVCEQTKYQILEAVNKIASENNLPASIITMILKEIATESSNNSLGIMIAQNKLVSPKEYEEFIAFKNNQNGSDKKSE